MRCVCCDKILSDYESTIKSSTTGEYLDTCCGCLAQIPEVEFVDRPDLSDIVDEVEGDTHDDEYL